MIHIQDGENIFDHIPALAPPRQSELGDELLQYIRCDVESVPDVFTWWYERHTTYPCLSRMALDYLNIPGLPHSCFHLVSHLLTSFQATSVDVERLFSRGRILLSHVQNRMSVQTTRAILCVGIWSKMGLVKNSDLQAVCSLEDIEEEPKSDVEEDEDIITEM